MLTVMLTSQGLLTSTTEEGVFDVKVLVADGKDYSTHKWAVTVNEQPPEQGFGITGAAVGLVDRGSSSLLDWLRGLF